MADCPHCGCVRQGYSAYPKGYYTMKCLGCGASVEVLVAHIRGETSHETSRLRVLVAECAWDEAVRIGHVRPPETGP